MFGDDGIYQKIKLLLDREAARRMEQDAQNALDRGTDPKEAERNLSRIDAAMGRLKGAAVKLGGALAGLFALREVTQFGMDAVKTFSEADAVWNRLAGTLKNAGVEFGAVRGEIEKAARAMQDATQVGDEDFAAILTDLTQISGDYARSLRSVQVVADLAAAKQMDFRTAAQLVGRAMIGETATLKRYGIVVEDGADAVEAIRKQFAGMAANEGATLQGRLGQLNNEWGDFKEEVGKAVIGGNDAAETVGILRDKVKSLVEWMQSNQGEIATFRGNLADIAGLAVNPIRITLEFIGGAAGKLAALLEVMRENRQRRMAGLPDWMTRGRGSGGETAPDFTSNPTRIDGLTVTASGGAGGGGGGGAGGTARNPWAPNAGFRARRPVTTERGPSRFRLPHGGPAAPKLTGPGGIIEPRVLNDFEELALGVFNNVESASQNAAYEMASAFQDAFSLMAEEGATIGNLFEGLGRGIAGSMLAGIAQMASGKAAENVAAAIEAAAYALGFTSHGNFASAGAAWSAAAQHGAAAAAWSALAGGAGAARGAVTGGRGAIPQATRDAGLGRAERMERSGPEIHVYIDPLDPGNPAYQKNVGAAMQGVRERYGDDAKITVHPRSAA